MTDVNQQVQQTVQAAKATVAAEVTKKENTFLNAVKDNAGKVAIVGAMLAVAVVAVIYHAL